MPKPYEKKGVGVKIVTVLMSRGGLKIKLGLEK